MIKTENLTRKYGDLFAIKDINLDLQAGDLSEVDDSSYQMLKVAVDDFFSGASEACPPDLWKCPRQVIATHSEGHHMWTVGK